MKKINLFDALKAKGITLEDGEKKMLDELSNEVNDAIEQAQKGTLESDEFKTTVSGILTTAFKNLKIGEGDAAKTVEEILRTQGEAISNLKNMAPQDIPQEFKAVAQQLKEYIESHKDEWDAFTTGKQNTFGISPQSAVDKSGKKEANIMLIVNKAPGTMTVGGNTSGSAFVPRPVYEGGLTDLVRNRPFLEDFSNTSNVSSPRLIITEKKNPDGDADFIGEGVAKPLIDFDIATTTMYAKKVADMITVSTEMLQDIDFIAAEIENELKYQVDIKVDEALLTGAGDGTEGNVDLKGITQYAAGFVLTSITTTTPNNFDALRASIAQIVSMNFMPNYAFISPIDGANMDLVKGVDGHYVIPPFKSATGLNISGIRVIETNQIPVGDFLLGDMTRFNVRNYIAFFIAFGWVNNNFRENLVSILGERRLMSYIKSNHIGAFVYDSFADVKTAITAPAI